MMMYGRLFAAAKSNVYISIGNHLEVHIRNEYSGLDCIEHGHEQYAVFNIYDAL